MSEWYDNQEMKSSNFHKLLQDRIDKANPHCKLTAEKSKRLVKFEAVADKLQHGENVQNRQLQTWLAKNVCAQIEVEW